MKTLSIKAILVMALLPVISHCCMLYGAAPQDTLDVPDSLVAKWKNVNVFYDDNEKCLKCHGEDFFTLHDTVTGVSRIKNMFQDYHINRDDFYSSVHKSFTCTDCHSSEYAEFPHKLSARLEEYYTCLDCHGNDENYKQFNFEEIQVEYDSSVHAKVDNFSCWKCHNPHSYKLIARDTRNISEIVLYDNNICLGCHANFNQFRLLSDRDEINVVSKHEWLPNQVLHFENVRCIECHTQISDSVLIAHTVLPKEKAVRNCTECHSSDSRLMSTLYKFESKDKRKNGFLNSIILGESYVIGASRNMYLGYASFIVFFGLLVVFGVHIFFRIINSKKNKNG
jgi:Zn finger protein HypA/HybF involved in hydrogenase expression